MAVRAPSTPTAPAPAAGADATRGLAALLRIADGYRDRGEVRQALEMYIDLLARFGHLPDGGPVRDRVQGLAEWYESRGDFRQARALWEKLL